MLTHFLKLSKSLLDVFTCYTYVSPNLLDKVVIPRFVNIMNHDNFVEDKYKKQVLSKNGLSFLTFKEENFKV